MSWGDPISQDQIPGGGLVSMAPEGQRSFRNKNVFNVEYHDWMQPYGAKLSPDGRFAQFDTFEDSVRAATDLIKRNYAGLTIKQGIKKFAPTFRRPDGTIENPNTPQRIKETAALLKVSPDTKIGDVPLGRFMQIQAKYESPSEINPAIWGEVGDIPINLSKRANAVAGTTGGGWGETIDPKEMAKWGETVPAPTGPSPAPTQGTGVQPQAPEMVPGGFGGQPDRPGLMKPGPGTPPAVGPGGGGAVIPMGGYNGMISSLKKLFPSDPEMEKQGEKNIWNTVKSTFLDMPNAEGFSTGLRDLFQPGGYDRLNAKAATALASPEAGAFAALDPMVAVAGLGGVREAINPVAAKAVRSPQLETLSKVVTGVGEKYNPTEIKRLITLAKDQFGIDLTVPELTNSPTLKALWTRLAKTPGPQAEKLANYITEIRNPQIEAAINQELKNISPSGATGWQAGGQTRSAAQNIEERLKSTRKAVTQPIYKAAFAETAPVDIEPILTDVQTSLTKYPEGHPSRAALQQVERMLTKDAEKQAQQVVKEGGIAGPVQEARVAETDLETLHNSKTGIDQLLEKAKQDKSIDNDTRRLLTRVKVKLTGAMERDNPLYGEAQRTFRLLSKPLTDFRYGSPNLQPRDPHIKTIIARIADLGAEEVEKVPGIVFSSKPGQITRTRAYFEKAYPGTWDSMVRSHIEGKLSKVKDTVIEREGNVGGAFKRALFNDPAERAKLQAALPPEKFTRLSQFMDVLDKTRRIIYTNSETAFQMEAGRILEQGGATEIINSIPVDKKGVLNWVAQKFDKVNNPAFASKLADAMLNPENAKEISKLARMPNTPKKALETSIFLENVGVKGSTIYEKKTD